MTPHNIRLELFDRSITMKSIGAGLEPPVTLQAVKFTIERKCVSRRIMEAVARAIDKDKEKVFPEYFV